MAGDSKLFQEALKRGSAHAWNELWDKAAEEYRRALGEFPDDVSARTYLAMALYKSGAFRESLELYKGLLNAQPSNLTMLQRVAELQQKIDDNLSAAVSYGRLADAHTRRGAPREAFRAWQKLVEITPGDPVLWNSLISAALQVGAVKEVIPGYLGLARDFALQSRFQEAIQIAQRAQTLDPQSPLVAPMLAAIRKGIEYSFRAASFGEEVYPEDLMRYIPSVEVLSTRIRDGEANVPVLEAPAPDPLPAVPVDVSGIGRRVLEVLFRPTVESMGRDATIDTVRNQLARLGNVVDVQTRVEGKGSVVFVIMLATSLDKDLIRRTIGQSSSEKVERALQVDPQELLRSIEILEPEAKDEGETTSESETALASVDAEDSDSPVDAGLTAASDGPADGAASIEPEIPEAGLTEPQGEALAEAAPPETETEVAISLAEDGAGPEEAGQEQAASPVEEPWDERIAPDEVSADDTGEAVEEGTGAPAREEIAETETVEPETEGGVETVEPETEGGVEEVEPEPDTVAVGDAEVETAAVDEPLEIAIEGVATEEATDVSAQEPGEDTVEASDDLEIIVPEDEPISDDGSEVERLEAEPLAIEEPQPDESQEDVADVVAVDVEPVDAEAVDAEAVDAEAVDAEAVDAESVDAEPVDAEVDQPALEEAEPVPLPEEVLARLMRQAEEARASGQLDEAIAAYEEAVAAGVAGSRQLLELGELYEAAGDEEAAYQSFARAVEISPDLVRARLGLARIDLQKHRLDSAETLARKSVEESARDGLGPEKTSSIGLLLEILRERAAYGDLGRAAEGLGWLKSVAETANLPASLAGRIATVPRELLGPSVGEHLDEIAVLPGFVRGEVTTSLWKAEQMLGEAKLRSAADEMYRVVSTYPDFLPAQSLLGRVLVAQGRLAEAGERSRRLVDLYHFRDRDDSALEVLEWMAEGGLAREAEIQQLNVLLRAHGRERQVVLVEEETAAARRAEQERRTAEESARAAARMGAFSAAEDARQEAEEAARRAEEETARKATEDAERDAERRAASEEALRNTLEELAKKAEEEEEASAGSTEDAAIVEEPGQGHLEPVPPAALEEVEESPPSQPTLPEKSPEDDPHGATDESTRKQGGLRGMFRALRGAVRREPEEKTSEPVIPGTDTAAGAAGLDALLRLAESRYAFGDAKGAAILLRSALQDERIASDLATKVAMLRVLQLLVPSDDELQATLRGILDKLGLPGELVD